MNHNVINIKKKENKMTKGNIKKELEQELGIPFSKLKFSQTKKITNFFIKKINKEGFSNDINNIILELMNKNLISQELFFKNIKKTDNNFINFFFSKISFIEDITYLNLTEKQILDNLDLIVEKEEYQNLFSTDRQYSTDFIIKTTEKILKKIDISNINTLYKIKNYFYFILTYQKVNENFISKYKEYIRFPYLNEKNLTPDIIFKYIEEDFNIKSVAIVLDEKDFFKYFYLKYSQNEKNIMKELISYLSSLEKLREKEKEKINIISKLFLEYFNKNHIAFFIFEKSKVSNAIYNAIINNKDLSSFISFFEKNPEIAKKILKNDTDIKQHIKTLLEITKIKEFLEKKITFYKEKKYPCTYAKKTALINLFSFLKELEQIPGLKLAVKKVKKQIKNKKINLKTDIKNNNL